MVNNKIIDLVINNATTENKNIIIKELFKHIDNSYDYNDNKKNHLLEMLIDLNAIITIDKVNIDYIVNNFNIFMYESEKYNTKNIKIENVDNINCIVKITYDYIEKINEDRDDVSYTSSYVNINFIDNPNILNK